MIMAKAMKADILYTIRYTLKVDILYTDLSCRPGDIRPPHSHIVEGHLLPIMTVSNDDLH